jgi:ABC-type nitrate/sulfonate/bicarbonate transport system substrate-binding protein
LGCELAIQLGAGSVIIDARRGDGPIGAGNYSFAALATTDSNIERNPDRIEAVIRAIVRAQSIIRSEPQRAAEVVRKVFPTTEGELMARILQRDAEFYRPSISTEAIDEMSRFAHANGLLSAAVSYEQVVAIQFRRLWSE